MIVEYHRPARLEEALKLLARDDLLTIPIGGGSALDRGSDESIAVVDLQSLKLNGLKKSGSVLELGASMRSFLLICQTMISDMRLFRSCCNAKVAIPTILTLTKLCQRASITLQLK